MELSSAIIGGVQAAGSSAVDENTFQKLLTYGFGTILEAELDSSTSKEGTISP